jgi:RNA-directed DNA polymerase
MTAMRPPSQLELALTIPGRGEAARRDAQEVETITATAEPESSALAQHLMEAICDPDNIEAALRAVVRNKGAPGVDGITVKQLPGMRAGLRLKINCSKGGTSRSRSFG